MEKSNSGWGYLQPSSSYDRVLNRESYDHVLHHRDYDRVLLARIPHERYELQANIMFRFCQNLKFDFFLTTVIMIAVVYIHVSHMMTVIHIEQLVRCY